MYGSTDRELFYYPGKPNRGPGYVTSARTARSRYRRPDRFLEDPDAIVIGSGIGGLGLASILAQKKGSKVLLLEASAVPGGCTHCHEIDGFEFNSGVDSIGDMDPRVGRGMFRPVVDYITGGQLDWAKMPDVHETCVFGDDVFEWYSSPEKNIEWVERLFPGEGDVRGYYDLEERIESSAWAWGATKVMPERVPIGARDAFYRTFGRSWYRYMSRSTNEVLKEELGFSDRLAAIFSYMYGNHGATPDEAPFSFHSANLFHYRTGAYYPVGGPAQVAECVIPIIERAGGQLAVSSPAEEILVDGNTAVGVRLEGGEVIHAPLIVSDASAYTTFMQLLPRYVAERHGYVDRFEEIGPSPGHCYLLVGYDEEIDLPKHIIWHMPEYDDVPPYDLSAADRTYKSEMRFEGMGGYLLSPSARDPIYHQRHPGKSTVIVLAEAPPAWVEMSNEDPVAKERMSRAIDENLMRLVHRHFPVLADREPAVRRAGLPMGCNPRAWHGSSLGLEPSGARFIEHTHWLNPKTAVQNLFLTGQDSFSAGFSGSALSARFTYAAITQNPLHMLKKRP